MKYRPDIDGLRAIAVLSVMLYHLVGSWLPGGFIGVDVFFVISGFVVTGSLVSSQSLKAGTFITAFYARRLARIIPALITMLVLTSILFIFFVPKAWLSFISEKTALAAFLGLSNWVMQQNTETYFAPRSEYNPFTHTWSLGVEEQFYVIFPLLCLLWLRARKNRPSFSPLVLAFIACLGLGSLAGCIWATSAQPNAAFYSIAFRFWELVAGALLFQLSEKITVRNFRGATFLKIIPALGLALLGVCLIFADPKHFPYPWAICAVAGTLMLIGGIHASTNPVRAMLASPILVWTGKRSYSLYLWHWPVYVLLRWTVGIEAPEMQALAVATSFLIACASYRYIEMPLRHNVFLRKGSAILQIGFFLLVIIVGLLAAKTAFKYREQISLSTVNRNVANWYPEIIRAYNDKRVCTIINQLKEFPGGNKHIYQASDCTIPLAPHKLFVLGDSHATAYNPMFEQFSAETGSSVTVYADAGCPFLDLRSPMSEKNWAPKCVGNWQAATRDLLARAGKGDILFLPTLRMFRFGDQWAYFEHIDVAHMDQMAFGQAAMESAKRAQKEAMVWLRPFSEKGVKIVFEAPKPIFKSPPFRCADSFNANNPICKHGQEMPRRYLEKLRAPVIASMNAISTILPDTQIWDPFPLLCKDEVCKTFDDNMPLFFDADHISGYSNTLLYPHFKNTIINLMGKNSEQASDLRR